MAHIRPVSIHLRLADQRPGQGAGDHPGRMDRRSLLSAAPSTRAAPRTPAKASPAGGLRPPVRPALQEEEAEGGAPTTAGAVGRHDLDGHPYIEDGDWSRCRSSMGGCSPPTG